MVSTTAHQGFLDGRDGGQVALVQNCAGPKNILRGRDIANECMTLCRLRSCGENLAELGADFARCTENHDPCFRLGTLHCQPHGRSARHTHLQGEAGHVLRIPTYHQRICECCTHSHPDRKFQGCQRGTIVKSSQWLQWVSPISRSTGPGPHSKKMAQHLPRPQRAATAGCAGEGPVGGCRGRRRGRGRRRARRRRGFAGKPANRRAERKWRTAARAAACWWRARAQSLPAQRWHQPESYRAVARLAQGSATVVSRQDSGWPRYYCGSRAAITYLLL